MKERISNYFLSSPFYNQLRYSKWSKRLFTFFNKENIHTVNYYENFIPLNEFKDQLVFDIGANKGNKTQIFVDLGSKVICLEPEKNCISTLKYRFGGNNRVTIVEKGVSNIQSTTKFKVKNRRSGLNSLSDKWMNEVSEGEHKFVEEYEIELTTLDDLIKEYGIPFYIKIDVEGYEKNVIGALTKRIKYISFEANLPIFKAETLEIINYLSNLCKDIVFKYSVNENYTPQDWINKEKLVNIIGNETDEKTFEIFVKMES